MLVKVHVAELSSCRFGLEEPSQFFAHLESLCAAVRRRREANGGVTTRT